MRGAYFIISFFENFVVLSPEFLKLRVPPFLLIIFLAIGKKCLLIRFQPIQIVLHWSRSWRGEKEWDIMSSTYTTPEADNAGSAKD